MCPRFLSVSDGSGEYTCGRCTQVEELLSLVTELQEEVGGLRTVRELEKEMDWWDHSLPSLRHMRQPATKEVKDPLLSRHQPEGGDLRDGGMEASFCSGQMVIPLPVYLTLPGAHTTGI